MGDKTWQMMPELSALLKPDRRFPCVQALLVPQTPNWKV